MSSTETQPTPVCRRATPVKHPPLGIRDKLRRAVWRLVNVLLFLPSPVPFHAWRRAILRAFGAKIGRNARVYPSVRIHAPWNLTIEEDATIGWNAILYSVDRIHLGPRAIVSQAAHLCTASHDHNSETFDLVTAPIVLQEDSWVAAEAFVGPGVTVHSGAVVAARCVVTRSVPERTIVAGNPARPVSVRAIIGRNHLR